MTSWLGRRSTMTTSTPATVPARPRASAWWDLRRRSPRVLGHSRVRPRALPGDQLQPLGDDRDRRGHRHGVAPRPRAGHFVADRGSDRAVGVEQRQPGLEVPDQRTPIGRLPRRSRRARPPGQTSGASRTCRRPDQRVHFWKRQVGDVPDDEFRPRPVPAASALVGRGRPSRDRGRGRRRRRP